MCEAGHIPVDEHNETMPEQDTDVNDTDEEQEETFAWAQQTPTTRLSGDITGIIYAGQLDSSTQQNGTSFGLVFENPEVINGTLWRNQEKPDDATTAEGVEDDEPRPTDYRIADPDDRDTTIANGALVTDEAGPNTYGEADGFDDDETLVVWYNGLSGQRIARVLDFNGRPWADWTDDGQYLVKGLYQVAEGWRENPSQRGQMVQNGKAPRVARAPILRQRVDIQYGEDGNVEDVSVADETNASILVDISRAQSGRGYRAHVFDADAFADEFGTLDAEMPRNNDGYVKDDIESELEMAYTAAADSVLEEVDYSMSMYTGEGWPDEPDGWSAQSTSSVGSFGINADAGDESGLTAAQEQFVTEVVDEIAGTGLTPDEAFTGGLDGLIGKYQSNFDTVPEADDIRTEVYDRVSHLSVDELDSDDE